MKPSSTQNVNSQINHEPNVDGKKKSVTIFALVIDQREHTLFSPTRYSLVQAILIVQRNHGNTPSICLTVMHVITKVPLLWFVVSPIKQIPGSW